VTKVSIKGEMEKATVVYRIMIAWHTVSWPSRDTVRVRRTVEPTVATTTEITE